MSAQTFLSSPLIYRHYPLDAIPRYDDDGGRRGGPPDGGRRPPGPPGPPGGPTPLPYTRSAQVEDERTNDCEIVVLDRKNR